MKIAVFTDVHGNLEAMRAVADTIREHGADRVVCLGDLVGYGPNPNECVHLIHDLADVILAGNHDHAAAGCISTGRFNEYARESIVWTQTVLEPETAGLLKELPYIQFDENITYVHATPEAPDKWLYILSESDAFRNLMGMTQSICFIGHSHIPIGFMMNQSGEMYYQKDLTEAVIEPNKKYLINAGSVGQPRDGDPRACLGLLDTEKGFFRLLRLGYDIRETQKKMKKAGLPEFLIERLEYGR